MKTRNISVPSLKIDEAFIKRLGSIVEKSMGDLPKGVKKSEYRNITLQYMLRSEAEDNTFSSIDELSRSQDFPSGVYGLTVEARFYAVGAVQYVRIAFNNKYETPLPFVLSYQDEGKLLEVKAACERLFTEYKTPYSLFYELGLGKSIFLNLMIPYILAFGALVLVMKFVKLPEPRVIIGIGLWFVLTFAIGYCWDQALKYLFPKYDFTLGRNKPFRNLLRAALASLFLALLGSLVYDLARTLFR